MSRLLLVSLCVALTACGLRRPPIATAAAVGRALVWYYPPALFTWACAPEDAVAHGQVTRFEVWTDATTTPFDPLVSSAWTDAGLVAGPVADSYQYLLPANIDYRFVRSCGTGCAGTPVCGSRVGSIPAVPTKPRVIASPGGRS